MQSRSSHALRLFTFAAFALAVGSVRAADNPWNMSGPCPHVLAHYIPWFSYGNDTGWQGWKRASQGGAYDPEKRLPDGSRQIASVVYPLIGPYASSSHAVVRYHLATMRAAGIQGVVIDWQAQPAVEARTDVVFDEAAKLGMRVCICYEEKTNFVWPSFRNPATRDAALKSGMDDMRYIATRYASQSACLRYHGDPVVFLWRGGGSGKVGPNYFTPDEWRHMLDALPVKVVFGVQGLSPDYTPVAQFRFSWVTPNASANFGFTEGAAKLLAKGDARFIAASACPGFDDSPVWGWGVGPRVVPRRGLSLLKDTFDRALEAKPDLIQLVTWNDFNEGTVLEPTRSEGFDDLDAVADWTAAARGTKADHAAIRKPFLDYVAEASPTLKAELPPGMPADWIATRKLKVEVPDYLTTLAHWRNPENPLSPANAMKSWNFGFTYAADTKAAVEGDALRIDIGKADDTAWHTHILQTDIPLTEGRKYTLRFRAKADHDRPILALLQTMGGTTGDWHAVGLEATVPLTEEWQSFSYPFTATRLISSGSQFVFHLGQTTGTVWLADLSLTPDK